LETYHGLKEGDEVELEIKEKAKNGQGIGRAKGLIIFVDSANVGEKVKIRITRIAARHAYGEIVQRLHD
jgi:predicted RNA-binding protein with TRAM domain